MVFCSQMTNEENGQFGSYLGGVMCLQNIFYNVRQAHVQFLGKKRVILTHSLKTCCFKSYSCLHMKQKCANIY